MLLIAHRGCIDGPNETRENSPDFILEAIQLGFDVEIDVNVVGSDIMLGHDRPQYKIEVSFLKNSHLWCHAKNLEALGFLLSNGIRCFWHQEDDYTITSDGYIWAYPGRAILHDRCVIVLPESANYTNLELSQAMAICTDYPIKYQKEFNF